MCRVTHRGSQASKKVEGIAEPYEYEQPDLSGLDAGMIESDGAHETVNKGSTTRI